jgi:HAD superfamily hydrolase (TIGR01549 family)
MKNIFFDLDGTLLHYTQDYDRIVEDTFNQVHGFCTDSLVKSYSEQFYKNFDNFVENPYREAFESTGINCDSDAMTRVLQQKEIEMCKKPPDTEEMLELLSGEYRLGVLTNGVTDWQHTKLEEFGLSQYFDSVVVSYEANAHKPNKEVFDFAEETLSGEEYILIGDSLEDDINGAENAGWNAMHYDQNELKSLNLETR